MHAIKRWFTFLTCMMLSSVSLADASILIHNGILKELSPSLQITYRILDRQGNLHFGPDTFSINSEETSVVCFDGEGAQGSASCDNMHVIGYSVIIDSIKTPDSSPKVTIQDTCSVKQGLRSDGIDLTGMLVGDEIQITCH